MGERETDGAWQVAAGAGEAIAGDTVESEETPDEGAATANINERSDAATV
jgi:hypothetical protein